MKFLWNTFFFQNNKYFIEDTIIIRNIFFGKFDIKVTIITPIIKKKIILFIEKQK